MVWGWLVVCGPAVHFALRWRLLRWFGYCAPGVEFVVLGLVLFMAVGCGCRLFCAPGFCCAGLVDNFMFVLRFWLGLLGLWFVF